MVKYDCDINSLGGCGVEELELPNRSRARKRSCLLMPRPEREKPLFSYLPPFDSFIIKIIFTNSLNIKMINILLLEFFIK